MAASTTTSTPLSLSSSSAPSRLQSAAAAAAPSQCVTIPTLPPPPAASVHSRTSLSKTAAYCRKIVRSVVAKATVGEAAVAAPETPEIIKTIQEAWDKVEDKYAVASLAVAGGVGLVSAAGMISAIDRLPLVPGVLELVGIGYTGWFAYRNLVFKPEREALIQKIKNTFNDIIGTS